MKEITDVYGNSINVDKNAICVTFTDAFLSGWDCNGNKPHKQVFICKCEKDAFALMDRLSAKKHGAKYVHYRYGLPYYSPNKYTSSVREFDPQTDFNF